MLQCWKFCCNVGNFVVILEKLLYCWKNCCSVREVVVMMLLLLLFFESFYTDIHSPGDDNDH